MPLIFLFLTSTFSAKPDVPLVGSPEACISMGPQGHQVLLTMSGSIY